MKITIGRPITVGVMKEANKFSFILILKGCWFLKVLLILLMVSVGSHIMRLLVV